MKAAELHSKINNWVLLRVVHNLTSMSSSPSMLL